MERYHKAVGAFNEADIECFTTVLNNKRFIFLRHFYEQVRTRFSDRDLRTLGDFMQSLKLQAGQAFEYYVEAGRIEKACYRVPFNSSFDVILVLSNRKDVITIYSNAVGDSHKTLRAGQYDIR